MYTFACLVFALSIECKSVLWLAIRNLVYSKEGSGSINQPREMLIYILDIYKRTLIQAHLELQARTIYFGCHGIIDINSKYLPIGLSFIQHSHHTQNLDLLDLTLLSNCLANFNDIDWIIITLCVRLGMNVCWVLPSLSVWCQHPLKVCLLSQDYLR